MNEQTTAQTSGDPDVRCAARRVHPYSSDYWIRCVRNDGHDGQHTVPGCLWDDDSDYALPPARASVRPKETR